MRGEQDDRNDRAQDTIAGQRRGPLATAAAEVMLPGCGPAAGARPERAHGRAYGSRAQRRPGCASRGPPGACAMPAPVSGTLVVPQFDMPAAADAMRDVGVHGTVKNIKGNRRKPV